MRDRRPELVLDPTAATDPTSVRVTVVQEESAHPLLDTTGDDWLTTVPHLLLREVVAFSILVAVLALLSYLVDAPLLDLADPAKTPNPSKSPWYFLGIQELLHYYPPLVSGILLPGLAILALLVIPYFDINVERSPFLSGAGFGRHLGAVWTCGILANLVFFVSSSAGPVWPLIATTVLILVTISLPLFFGRGKGVGAWIATRSLPFWIFTWFVLSWAVLTAIGVYFRGPGWSFTLPWMEGIYG
ncbi:MAG: hypothetical protein WBH75_17810 [Thermoanaerobaculia bacterium]